MATITYETLKYKIVTTSNNNKTTLPTCTLFQLFIKQGPTLYSAKIGLVSHGDLSHQSKQTQSFEAQSPETHPCY